MSSSPIALEHVHSFREKAMANGYNLVRVRTSEKRPVGKQWQMGEPPELLLQVAPESANTGLLCRELQVVDIDVDDPSISQLILQVAREHLPRTPLVRFRSGSSRVAIIYRSAEGEQHKKVVSGSAGKVEILGSGQQIVVDGVHPSGAKISWKKGTPATVPLDQLPAVSSHEIASFLEACPRILDPDGPSPTRVTHEGNYPSGIDLKVPGNDAGWELGAGIDTDQWFCTLALHAKATVIDRCLNLIDNTSADPRSQWLAVLFAVADAGRQGCPNARDLALAWSKRGKGWTCESDFDAAWNSAKPGKITVGTLLYLGERAGADLQALRDAFLPPEVVGVKNDAPPPVWRSKTWSAEKLSVSPPKRQYLHGSDFVRGAVTMLAAPGGKGKSTWLLTAAIACASGRPLLGSHIFGGPLRALYINAEDSNEEIERRMHAAIIHHSLKPSDLRELHIMGAGSMKYALLQAERTGPQVNHSALNDLLAEIDHHRADVVLLDPLVSFFGGVSLNDNSAAALLVGKLAAVAAERRLAVVIAHHVAKNRETNSAESAMGGAMLTNLSRVCLAIEPLSASKAMELGVMPCDADRYFSIAGTKQNMSPSGQADRWYRLVSIDLHNAQPPVYLTGDRVAAVEQYKPGTAATALNSQVASAALAVIASAVPPLSPSSQGGNDPVPAILAAIAPYFGGKARPTDAKAVLQHLLSTGQIFTGPYKQTRQGRGAYTRQALYVAGAQAPVVSQQTP
jgi:hypothetical protein